MQLLLLQLLLPVQGGALGLSTANIALPYINRYVALQAFVAFELERHCWDSVAVRLLII